MTGISDRVIEFLKGWPIAKQQLEELTKEKDRVDEEEIDSGVLE